MEFEKILIDRFNSETKKLRLLKEVQLNFASINISCKKMFVTSESSLKKKGYLNLPLYQYLEPIAGAVVYYYKFCNSSESIIRDAFHEFKRLKQRNCSALPKRKGSKETSIMYVGSERSSLSRRTMEHMGYAHQHTGGLQISKWAPDIGLELELYYAKLENRFLPVLRQVETALAHHLDPLIGRHEK